MINLFHDTYSIEIVTKSYSEKILLNEISLGINEIRVLMEVPNVLFLDEPANDLDIETLNIL